MRESVEWIDQKTLEMMQALDIGAYASLPEEKRSEALFRLMDYLPVAAFGSPAMWDRLNSLISEAFQIESRLEHEAAAQQTANVIGTVRRI